MLGLLYIMNTAHDNTKHTHTYMHNGYVRGHYNMLCVIIISK